MRDTGHCPGVGDAILGTSRSGRGWLMSIALTMVCLELSVDARVERVEPISMAEHSMMSFEPGMRDFEA